MWLPKKFCDPEHYGNSKERWWVLKRSGSESLRKWYCSCPLHHALSIWKENRLTCKGTTPTHLGTDTVTEGVESHETGIPPTHSQQNVHLGNSHRYLGVQAPRAQYITVATLLLTLWEQPLIKSNCLFEFSSFHGHFPIITATNKIIVEKLKTENALSNMHFF